MTQQNNLQAQSNNQATFRKPMIVGAGIAFFLIALFLFPVEGKSEWGKFWMIRPLIIVPLAGATGGLCYYVLTSLASRGKINKFFAVLLSIIIYIVGLWMGFVLGLDGTLWN